MNNLIIAALATISFVGTSLLVPLKAQDASKNTQSIDHHAALADALTTDMLIRAAFEAAMETGFKGVLRADPLMVELDASCPGLINRMADAVSPIMEKAHRRDYQKYRNDILAVFKKGLSDEHAKGAAEFFSSDLGQRFVLAITQNMSLESTIQETLDDPEDVEISSGALSTDSRVSALRGIQALSAEDRQTSIMLIGGSAWGREFAKLQPKMGRLQLEMANSDYLPEENAVMDRAIDQVLEQSSESCELDLGE